MPPNPHSLMKGAKVNIMVINQEQMEALPPGMLPPHPQTLAQLQAQGDTLTIETPWGDEVKIDLNQWPDRDPETTYIGVQFGKHIKELESMTPEQRREFHQQLKND